MASVAGSLGQELTRCAREGDLESLKHAVGLLLESSWGYREDDSVRWMLEKALGEAVEKGHPKVVEYLLRYDDYTSADLRLGDAEGEWSCAMVAACHGHKEVVEVLISHGADLDATAGDQNSTALHVAAAKNHADIVSLLLSSGMRASRMNDYGVTPLMNAANKGNMETAEVLLATEEGMATIDAQNHEGLTALMWATYSKHLTMVQYLISKGADTQVRGKNGWKAINHAALNEYWDIVEALAEAAARVGIADDKESPCRCCVALEAQRDQHYCDRYGGQAALDPLMPWEREKVLREVRQELRGWGRDDDDDWDVKLNIGGGSSSGGGRRCKKKKNKGKKGKGGGGKKRGGGGGGGKREENRDRSHRTGKEEVKVEDESKAEVEAEEVCCSICLLVLEEGEEEEDDDEGGGRVGGVMTRPCQHRYHAACLNLWTEKCTQKAWQAVCPTCRCPL